MRGTRLAAVLPLTALACSAAGLAASGADGAGTSDALATFRLIHDPTEDKVVRCTHADGEYIDSLETASGTMTSPNPALSGEMTAKARAVINTTTREGFVAGTLRLRDPATGELKMKGDFASAIKGVAIKGVIDGQLSDGRRIIANISALHDIPRGQEPHALTGTLGGPSAPPLDLAVVMKGCR